MRTDNISELCYLLDVLLLINVLLSEQPLEDLLHDEVILVGQLMCPRWHSYQGSSMCHLVVY